MSLKGYLVDVDLREVFKDCLSILRRHMASTHAVLYGRQISYLNMCKIIERYDRDLAEKVRHADEAMREVQAHIRKRLES